METEKKTRKRRLSRLRKPSDMSLEEWQIELRRQFGPNQDFRVRNVGGEPIFSEFQVTNPETERTYRVAIRGSALGENYCSCPDFAVNNLGTCKHVEHVLARLGKTARAKAELAAGFRPPYSEVYLHYGAAREVLFRAGTECGEGFRRYARRYFDSRGRLKDEAYQRFPRFLKRTAEAGHEVRCYDDALAYVAQLRDRAELQRKIAQAFPRGAGSAAWKHLLKTSLYPYQRQGALFAAKAGRCLLADDMGLGKTIEAIAVAEILARCTGVERTLIVAPTSLKHQWKQEIDKFCDRRATVVEGLLKRRAECYRSESFYKITNYDVVHRDLEMIQAWRPELVILDEAQRIKNWKTRTAQSVKQLESEYALVLTGTPLENRLEELHSIVEFVDRFRLGALFRFLDKHQHVDTTGRVVGYRNLHGVSRTLGPILIRRTKEKVLDQLPGRLEKRMFIEMTDEQWKHHEENRETVARIVAKWRRYGFLTEKDQLGLQIALQNMRMSCNSTYLLDHETDHGRKIDEAVELLGEILEDPEARVVIFSQWVRSHELLIERLEKKGWEHVLFYGGVPSRDRGKLIERFKRDPRCRLFLSTDAGGVGLNLQHANVVFILDQPWNPAVLEQRIGRVHRLGQHRPVRVVHFVAKSTIEEGMLDVLKFKKSMFSGVLDGGKDEVFLGGTKLKRFMESVERVSGGIPGPQPSNGNGNGSASAGGGVLERVDEVRPPTDQAPEPRRPEHPAQKQPAAATAARAAHPPGQQPWGELLSAGLTLLDRLGKVLSEDSAAGRPGRSAASVADSLLARDEKTGENFLKIPVPPPEALGKLAAAIRALGKSL